MGRVYKGLDAAINRHVAIKILSLHSTDTDAIGQELRARFRQEAQASGRLNHPGIVSVFEYGEDGDQAYIAMELVEGHTLSQLIKQKTQFTIQGVSNLITQMLDALQHAHSKGVVHRDIKPSNVMLTANDEIKITDFGIARIESSELTQAGTVIGTPGYMSPEQLMGHRVDHRSDIFSCGVMLYELLTGERAFSGSDTASTMYKIVHSELAPASEICPAVPVFFDQVLAHALAKNPEDRFASAKAFAQAIIQNDNQTVTIVPTGKLDEEKTVIRPSRIPQADIPLPIRRQQAKQPTPNPKNRWLYPLSASVLVFVLGIATLLWLSLSDDPPEEKSAAIESELPPAYATGDQLKDCATCPEMIVVPPGEFIQGSPVSELGREPNEGPQRSVRLDYFLAVGQFEVTRQQFGQFISESDYPLRGCTTYEEGGWEYRNDRGWQSPGFHQDQTEPVTCVSWEDAQYYTDWLTKKTGNDYRLLSASEWEYIARAGTDTSRSWGDAPKLACLQTNVADQATQDTYPGWEVHDCKDGYVHTAPVKDLKPNEFGIHATLGNVFEWVEDCWNDSYQGAPSNGSPWIEGDCSKRSLRGGSWYSQPKFVRSAFRNRFNADVRASTIGFRVALELPRD